MNNLLLSKTDKIFLGPKEYMERFTFDALTVVYVRNTYTMHIFNFYRIQTVGQERILNKDHLHLEWLWKHWVLFKPRTPFSFEWLSRAEHTQPHKSLFI